MIELINNSKLKKWLLFITLTIGFLIFDIIYYMLGIDIETLTYSETIGLLIIKYIFFLILLIIIYRKYLKEKWIDFKTNFKSYFSISFRDWFCGFLIMILANSIISRFITGLGENETAVQDIISQTPFIAFFLTTVFAPIIEELIFRKSLQDCFNKPVFYMITSGLIFGYMHVLSSSNPYEYLLIISYGALGFFFAKTITTTDNIYCTIMMHMLHNGFLTVLSMVIL